MLGRQEWLTGGAVGVEASLCAAIVDVLALVVLLRGKGSLASPHPGRCRIPLAA
jgi:hypothetical protein